MTNVSICQRHWLFVSRLPWLPFDLIMPELNTASMSE